MNSSNPTVQMFRCLSKTLALAAWLCGCVGLTETQNSVSQLDQSVHTAATAEASFLTAIQAADCDSQFYTAAYKYAFGAVDFQLAGYCTPKVITPAQVALRTNMMDALTLYADSMLALASSASDKQLDTNSQALASRLQALAAAPGGIALSAKATPEIVAGVETAFTEIAELALAKKKYDGVTGAAKAMRINVASIVKALQVENEGFAAALIARHKVLEGQLKAAAVSAAGDSNKFFAVLQARTILATASGLTDQSLATVDWDSQTFAEPISDALPAIERANDAVARGATASVSAAAHDLYSRAQAARDLYNNLATSK